MRRLRNRHFFILDLLLLPLAAYLAFVLRLETIALDRYGTTCVVFALVAMVVAPFMFQWMGVYSRYWRYASIDELSLLTGAVLSSVAITSFLSIVIIDFTPDIASLPRSIPFIFLLLTLAIAAGPRLVVRILARYPRWRARNGHAAPVLVMGAGDAGAIIVREFQDNPQLGMEVVGFLDDDVLKHGMRIHGVPVLGDRHIIPRAARNLRVRQVIIAMPTAPGKEIRDIVRICEAARVQTKTIPGIFELLNDSVSVNQLRDVQIEDLLRRDPVETDIAAVQALVQGKRVLVTGGGGSIGSELCRQLARCRPAQLIVLGHGENSIFEITSELSRGDRETRGQGDTETKGRGDNVPLILSPSHYSLIPLIADIRFPDRVRTVFEEYRPEIVFHAAAHKHVSLMETNPGEAITNNVLGTRHLLEAALATEVGHFVMVSTDKAVNPTGIMGASKRAAELLVHQAARISGKPYVAVRFGNVLGSRGSVVLTFKRQIAAGGPVTVTHPDMKRYFMTIPEAVQLVLQAAALGHGGEVFVLDMGEPIKIVDLARDLIELSGLEVGRDIDIAFTGALPGEKLFEELFIQGESYQRTCHEKIYIAGNASRFVPSNLDATIAELEMAARRNDAAAIRHSLEALIPEYRPVDKGNLVQKKRERKLVAPG